MTCFTNVSRRSSTTLSTFISSATGGSTPSIDTDETAEPTACSWLAVQMISASEFLHGSFFYIRKLSTVLHQWYLRTNNTGYTEWSRKNCTKFYVLSFCNHLQQTTQFSPECSEKITVYQSMQNLYQLVKQSLINSQNPIHVMRDVTLSCKHDASDSGRSTDNKDFANWTRSSATAKSTAHLSCLVGVLYDIYRETNIRSTANQPFVRNWPWNLPNSVK